MSQSELIRKIVDLPELQQYYHIDERPERLPLHVLCPADLCEGADLHKFGHAVRVIHERPLSMDGSMLEITGHDRSETGVTVEFSYAPEGVKGTATLERDGSDWTVKKSTVFEG